MAALGGYDPAFLGSGGLNVPLPGFSSKLEANILKVPNGEGPWHKKTHYSLVMNSETRIASCVAVFVIPPLLLSSEVAPFGLMA
jgi:hypothetical protein